jgi:hypothetical protein
MVHRILIVEDEAIIAEEIATRLQAMGYGVAGIGASGEAAITLADQHQPDLVLMDIMLQGGIDGIAAAQHIYQAWSIPIVYLTAYGDEKTLQRAKFAGAFGYLLKPFKAGDLRATVEIAFTRHHTESQRQLSVLATHPRAILNTVQETMPYLSLFSHELRNPIAHIKLWTQLLQRHGETWSIAKKQEAFVHIQTATEQMGHLLDDFLALGRSSAPRPLLRGIPLDFVHFFEKLVQTHQFMVGDRYRLHLQTPSFPVRIQIDETVLGYIFNNLILNSIKYSLPGGEIELTILGNEQEVGCRISDRGIGISEADLELLFTPFYRGSNVGSIPGTGLGLAIVKRCIERCQGKITILSQLGQGTTVTVQLPILPH